MMIQKFLQWSKMASAGERAHAAQLLAQAYLGERFTGPERREAESAMVFLLEDPSPKVRLALAEALAESAGAPRNVVSALARDQIGIAGLVAAASPVLTDGDLVDLVADGRPGVQRAIALRRRLSVAVSAAIAEIGHESAVGDLLDNADAAIAAISLRRIAERFGGMAEVRTQLLDRAELPCDVRHNLILSIGDALCGTALVSAAIGPERVQRVTQEACRNATLRLAGAVPLAELPALVEHLRVSGKLTQSFLIHALCAGNVDFFAAAVISLSGYRAARVRGILTDGRDHTMRALYRAAGITAGMIDIFIDATLMWREAIGSDEPGGARSVPRRLIERHAVRAGADPALADLLMLIERLDLEWQRQNAREFALIAMNEAA